MTPDALMKIIHDTAYVRTGGSREELRCAEYLMARIAELGVEAHLETFPVEMATITEAILEIDGRPLPCRGYLCAGTATVEAPLYYLRDSSRVSLSHCRDKIVLIDGGVGYWRYRELLEAGALGFITYDGHVNYTDRDIDQKELRAYVRGDEKKLPGVNINVKDAVAIVASGAKTARITLAQDETMGESRNVVLELKGTSDDIIVCTAHYDSTSLSVGSYDNMTGALALLGMIEHFAANPHRATLRFVFCGSEERGLLGAKAYCADHEAGLEKHILGINIDMIGSIMGRFSAICSAPEAALHIVEALSCERDQPINPRSGVHSSDSTPIADRGIPTVSFARGGGNGTATIHNRYDTPALLSGEILADDIAFIVAFADRMANAVVCPIKREIPEKVRGEIDQYLNRKKA